MKEKNINKKNKIVAITITLASVIVLVGIGVAFFAASVSNANNEKFSTQTATLSLVFDDNDNGVSGTLNLGQSITKKFTIENTGTVDAYGKINWVDLVNTYMDGSLTWTLEQSATENGTYTTVGSGKVPTSSTATTKVLKNGLMVPVGVTYYYKLTITLNNLDINQSGDINASMHSQFSLEKGKSLGTDTIMNLVAGEPTNTTDIITKTAPAGSTCTNTLAYDNTTDNNLRYVGANPCNYITFNGETAGWRIVGIMNNIDDGTGNLETRIKLVRATSLGGSYSWDTSASGVNSGYGVNDWTQADLMTELNGDYLDTTLTENPLWYSYSNNTKNSEFNRNVVLKAEAQNLIDNAKWKLGTQSDITKASIFYTAERGTRVWGSEANETCNDGSCPRATEWIGKVALLYPSDFGYAVGGTVRSTCLEYSLSSYKSGADACLSNDWIGKSSQQWFLSPHSYKNKSIAHSGTSGVYDTASYRNYSVIPSVYLKSDVSISGGDGSPENPYTLS